MKDIFGNMDVRRGAKVPSQTEWNQVNNALTNIRLGDNDFGIVDINESGVTIPSESFFFPHIAQVEAGSTTSIISPDRLEDWYPFKDTMSVQTFTQIDTFNRTDASYAYYGKTTSDASSTSVEFEAPSRKVPAKPTDNADGGIVGYGWNLEATVTDVTFNGSSSEMVVTTEWTPGPVYDDDSQAELYTVDSASTGAWISRATASTNSSSREDIINSWLTTEGQDEITLVDISNNDIYDVEIRVPVAIYNWNIDQTKISRCIQLLFGNAAPSGGIQKSQMEPNLVDSISGHIEVPDNKEYMLELSAPTSGRIAQIVTESSSGTADAEIQINDIVVVFDDDVEFSTTKTTYPVDSSSTTANYAAGDQIGLVLSSASTSEDLKFTVTINRGLS